MHIYIYAQLHFAIFAHLNAFDASRSGPWTPFDGAGGVISYNIVQYNILYYNIII